MKMEEEHREMCNPPNNVCDRTQAAWTTGQSLDAAHSWWLLGRALSQDWSLQLSVYT